MSSSPVRVGRFGNLTMRLLFMVVCGAVFFAAAGGYVAYRLGFEQALRNSRSALEALAVAVERTAAIGVFARDPVVLQEIAEGLARNELVAGVDVVELGGQVLAHVGAGHGEGAPAAGASIERPLLSPLGQPEPLGVLRIRIDDRRVHAAANRDAIALAVAMAAQAVLLAWLLYLVMARLVTRPIVRLANSLRLMTPGTAERLATPRLHRRDEMGALIAGANALLQANEQALHAERTLRAEVEAMEAQYRQIFDASSAGIFVLDGEGRLINGNVTVARLAGVPMEALRERPIRNFIVRVFERPEKVHQMIEESMLRGETVSADLELVAPEQQRRWVHCLISARKASGQTGFGLPGPGNAAQALQGTVEGVIYDITDRKGQEAAVRYRAEHDPLTGLKNRAGAQAVLEQMARDAGALGAPLAVLCLDLDGFKQINDQHGHHSGDEVLVACARRMRQVVRRTSDLVGRLGGDEFLIALRNVGPGDPILQEVLQELLDGLSDPVELQDGGSVHVGVSIGAAFMPLHGASPEELARAADAALYHVKRSGRQSYALAWPPVT